MAARILFLVQSIERWKAPSWERNISEKDIIQHTKITTEKSPQITTFFVYHKLWLGYGIEINRQIDFG